MPEATITELDAGRVSEHLHDLADLLHDCVHAGASVGFILPFSISDSRDFWQHRVLPSVRAGQRCLFVAMAGDALAGTVQLNIDLPPNQPHRCEVAKLLVHPDQRRRGIGAGLMRALEARARELGKRLITLDTRTGDAAEPLYATLGYQAAGVIPGYCLDPESARTDSTTYMYKAL